MRVRRFFEPYDALHAVGPGGSPGGLAQRYRTDARGLRCKGGEGERVVLLDVPKWFPLIGMGCESRHQHR